MPQTPPPSSPTPDEPLAPGDPVWDLLGRARPAPAPSPYFARRVLREVRFLAEENESAAAAPAPWNWRAWLRSWAPAAVALTLAVSGGWWWQNRPPGVGPVAGAAPTATVPGEDSILRANPEQRLGLVLQELDSLVTFEEGAAGPDETL